MRSYLFIMSTQRRFFFWLNFLIFIFLLENTNEFGFAILKTMKLVLKRGSHRSFYSFPFKPDLNFKEFLFF